MSTNAIAIIGIIVIVAFSIGGWYVLNWYMNRKGY